MTVRRGVIHRIAGCLPVVILGLLDLSPGASKRGVAAIETPASAANACNDPLLERNADVTNEGVRSDLTREVGSEFKASAGIY